MFDILGNCAKVEEVLKERLLELNTNVNVIKERVGIYPKENLKTKRSSSGFSYYTIDAQTKRTTYVKKKDIDRAKLVAQRDYEQSYLKIAEKEIYDLKRILSKNYSSKIEDCYSNINDGRKRLVHPFEVSDEDFIKQWIAKTYTPKEFWENDKTGYYTEKNERVRSKSEVIIANMLNELNIPYKYECPLHLGKVIVYPDFTILDVRERQEKYLEHFGMMGDLDYVSDMMLKITTYEQNNIFIGDKLICSFESAKRPLNISALKNKLKMLI